MASKKATFKTAQTGQTAAGHGRKKIAHDCVEAGAALLRESREHCAAQGAPPPALKCYDRRPAQRTMLH